MSKRLLSITGGLALALTASVSTLAQNTETKTTITTQTTKTVQHPDGTYTVIEYPADKEVMVDLSPTSLIPGAKGTAKIIRRGNDTTINLDLSGLTGDISSYNLYAIDPAGKFSLLGPVTVNNGTATQTFTTPLDKFMLVLSPETNLASIGADSKVVLKSTVPAGMAVIPFAQSGPKGGAPIGERVAATTTSRPTSAYNVPMLNIPAFRRGTDTHMRINFSGELAGSRANVFIEPRNDGPTQIKMRFHSLKRAEAGKRLVLWAVGPDNTYHRLGQVVNTGQRNEAQIQTETDLKDFGLFVTTENEGEAPSPTGAVVATIVR